MFIHLAFVIILAFQWLYCLLSPISSYTNPLIINLSFCHSFCKLLIIVNPTKILVTSTGILLLVFWSTTSQ